MEILLCWLKNNLLDLFVAGGTLGAMYYAYRSAKMSEMANKAQFSPLVVPIYFKYYPGNKNTVVIKNGEQIPVQSFFEFAIENRSEYKNAFAKNASVSINDSELVLKDWELQEGELETIHPSPNSRVDFCKRGVELIDFVPSIVKINYQDILGNEFETTCRLIKNNEHKGEIDYAWEYNQK